MKLLIDKFLEKKLEKALHPESIDAALEKVLAHSPKKQYIQNRFAVVQREIKAVRTVDDYVNRTVSLHKRSERSPSAIRHLPGIQHFRFAAFNPRVDNP